MKKLTTAILVLLAMTLTGCKNDNNRNVRFVDSYTIYTDTIRGHVYMHVYGGGILHAPDCRAGRRRWRCQRIRQVYPQILWP